MFPPAEKGEGFARPGLRLNLPAWVAPCVAEAPAVFADVTARMRFVIGLARRNVEEATGGPFAAAVFDSEGRLVAPGVNLVVTANCSALHAEVVALALAQQRLGRYDIGAGGTAVCELVASTEPCVMCFGAVWWSGVARLVCGARDEDARRIGFDEGPKLPDWQQVLEARGIAVQRDILRREAVAVLERYAALGGPLYNAGPLTRMTILPQ